nr:uncharacterized protein LOC113820775 [Penaeus vannamei]
MTNFRCHFDFAAKENQEIGGLGLPLQGEASRRGRGRCYISPCWILPGTSVLPAVSEDPGPHSPSSMMKLVVLALALAAASAGVIQHPGLGLTYAAAPLVHGAVPLVQPAPLTYTVGAAPPVNPAPYRVHTGVKTVVAAEPVEQHGYVIKY